ncbi:MAG: hypothetical protein ACJ0OP_02645 [Thermodesulfobacteriota bacterium]|jgi:predicted  nucleic acid-binding Zn-ribbon protein|nr:MAG: hypothetical protein EVA31_01715 [Candidatus Dadabacteria bacterium]|tara:strand:+ start:157 stop:366 length:210 start_codon:yes stop_codon:yes gene_type:complete
MDILDILDRKVKDTVEEKVRLEESLVNLKKSLENLDKENLMLREKIKSCEEETNKALSELEQIIKDLDI